MKANVGIIDKAVRLLAAFVITVLYFTHVITGTLAILLLVLAGVFVLTGLIRFCPLYLPFGINTWNKK
ncbi:MAG: DUF2892 domain-containing protein [Paludibacter sp.]|jgi:hypothetical protein|nr:DUF2892 domain-containing protein [Paludibacter sp.]